MAVKINYHGAHYPDSAHEAPDKSTHHAMKPLTDIIPLLLFFIAYQMQGSSVHIGGWTHTFNGLFSATAVLIAATILQVALTRVLSGRVEKRLWWLLAAVCVFGGATLLLRDKTYILWKPTVFNWVLALVFAGSYFIGQRNVLERMLGHQITLPRALWNKLLWLWTGNFTLVGGLNLLVAYQFDEAFWVSYKLYSALGFTLALTVITALMIAPWLRAPDAVADDRRDSRATRD